MATEGSEGASKLKICIDMDSDELHGYLIRNRIAERGKRVTIDQTYQIGILLYSFALHGIEECICK